MTARPILKGTLNVSSVVRIIDSTDGTPETGVVAATSGLAFNYRREGAAIVAITALNNLALLTTAHTDGGILHIADGYYRIDFQDAAFAAGADGVLLTGTATGMIVIGAYHPLFDLDVYDAVRAGLTALPDAAAEAAGGLYTRGAGAGQMNQAANGQIDANTERLGNVAQSLSDLKDFADEGYDPATNQVQGVVLVDTATDLTNLPSIPAAWLTAAGIAANAFTAAKFAAGALDGKGDWVLGIKKNTAANDFIFKLRLASDHVSPATGLTPVMTVSKDGAAFAAKDAGTTIAEIGTTGWYQVDAAAADLNGDKIIWKFAVATADDSELVIFTVP